MPRILIVEDEPLIAMMLAEWVSELGHETCDPAATVATAMSEITLRRPDAAILDVTLGDESCFPIAEHLDELGVPFAFATGHGPERLEERFGGRPALAKPYDFEAVRKVIEAMFARAA